MLLTSPLPFFYFIRKIKNVLDLTYIMAIMGRELSNDLPQAVLFPPVTVLSLKSAGAENLIK